MVEIPNTLTYKGDTYTLLKVETTAAGLKYEKNVASWKYKKLKVVKHGRFSALYGWGTRTKEEVRKQHAKKDAYFEERIKKYGRF